MYGFVIKIEDKSICAYTDFDIFTSLARGRGLRGALAPSRCWSVHPRHTLNHVLILQFVELKLQNLRHRTPDNRQAIILI